MTKKKLPLQHILKNFQMEEKKKLNVAAITDFSEHGTNAVRHGLLLAKIFGGELMIFSNFRVKKREFKSVFQKEEERKMTEFLQKKAEKTKFTVIEEPTDAKSLYSFAEANNVGLFVIAAAETDKETYFSRKKAFSFILPSRQPVLVTGSVPPPENCFKNVLLPLDLRPQNKEKVLWAGYFNRFYDSKIHILYSHFDEQHLQHEIDLIIAFAKKLYSNLEITDYEIHKITPTVDNMDKYSLSFAPQVAATLTVILMTHNRSLGDLILGVREKTLIGNTQGFPVLCINERPDLYVLCT